MKDYTESLYPVERKSVLRAGEARLQDFSTGRVCARAALDELGAPTEAIPVGTHREPIWPAGYIGSISHEAQMCVAIADHTYKMKGLGIDLATTDRLSQELKELICLPEEQTDKNIARHTDVDGSKLVFSAKEALFKTIFPRMRRYVDFKDVKIEFEEDGFTWHPCFLLEQLANASGKVIEGRSFWSNRFIVAVAWWTWKPD